MCLIGGLITFEDLSEAARFPMTEGDLDRMEADYWAYETKHLENGIIKKFESENVWPHYERLVVCNGKSGIFHEDSMETLKEMARESLIFLAKGIMERIKHPESYGATSWEDAMRVVECMENNRLSYEKLGYTYEQVIMSV